MNESSKAISKILLVFLCLYVFLVGISTLSKSIGGLTSPDQLGEGDMAQLKKVVCNKDDYCRDLPSKDYSPEEEEYIVKKQWVKVTSIEDEKYAYVFGMDTDEDGVCDQDCKTGLTKKKNVKKSASAAFLKATNSAFICLFIGVFATVLFQSSSTTTSLIVGMAGGGLISLSSAVPMVMGANIGTTVTNTLISLGHLRRGEEFKRAFAASTVHDFFNILAVVIFLPLEIMFGLLAKSANFLGNLFFTEISEEPFKSPIKQAVSWGVNQVKALIHTMSDSDWVLLVVSVIITLVMLFSIVKLLRSMVLSKVEAFFDKYIFKTVMRSIAFGFCLTVLVQSSSITTSVIVPLAGAGVLSLRQIFPFTLGANIGTTITSIMAALVLNPIAMVVAFSHLLFNVLAIVIIYPIKPLRAIPLRCAEKIAELSVKNKMIPLLYLGIVFVLIPITIILLGG